MNHKIILTLLLLSGHFFLFAQDPVKSYLDSAAEYRLSGDTMEVYYLSKAIELQPHNPTLYELRAYAKSYVPKDKIPKYGPKSAIEDFDIAIRLSPKNSIYYEQRGYQRFLLGHYNQAIKDYTKAIRFDKKNAAAFRKRADVFWAIESFARAGNDYYMASELDTASIYNLRKVGDCFYEIGNLRSALEYYSKAIKKAEAKPYFEDGYIEDYVLSFLYSANSKGYMDRIKEAIEDYTSAIEYNEKFQGLIEYTQEAHRLRGMSHLNLDNKEEGCKDLKTADSLGDKEAKEYLDLYCK